MEDLLMKAAGLLCIISAGYILKQKGVFCTKDAQILSKIIIHLTLPGALIGSFASFTFAINMVTIILLAAAANCALLVVAVMVSRGKDAKTRALYMLNMPSYNIGTFVLPLVQSFLPPEGLLAVAMFDAGNSPMNSGGAYAVTTALIDGKRMKLRSIIGRMFHSVPFDTFMVMLVMGIVGVRLPEPIYTVAGMFGQANSFLAMLMMGIIFELQIDRKEWKNIFLIVGIRYGFGMIIAALSCWVLPVSESAHVVVALAMLAPIPSVTLAYCNKCGCKPSLVGVIHSMCLPISLCLSLIVLFLWKV